MSSSFLHQFVINPGDEDEDWLNADFSDPVQLAENGDNTDNDNVSELDDDNEAVLEATQLHQVGYYDPDGTPYGHVYTKENVHSPRILPLKDSQQFIDLTLDDDVDEDESTFVSPFALVDTFYKQTMQKRVDDANRLWGFSVAENRSNNLSPRPVRTSRVQFSMEIQYFTSLEASREESEGRGEDGKVASILNQTQSPLQTILKEPSLQFHAKFPGSAPHFHANERAKYPLPNNTPGSDSNNMVAPPPCEETTSEASRRETTFQKSHQQPSSEACQSNSGSLFSNQEEILERKDPGVGKLHSPKHLENYIQSPPKQSPRALPNPPGKKVLEADNFPETPSLTSPPPSAKGEASLTTPKKLATVRSIRRIPINPLLQNEKKVFSGLTSGVAGMSGVKSQIYTLSYDPFTKSSSPAPSPTFHFVGPKPAPPKSESSINPILQSILDPKVLISLSKTCHSNSPLFRELKLQIVKNGIDKSVLEQTLGKKLLELIYDMQKTSTAGVNSERDFHKGTLSSKLKINTRLSRPLPGGAQNVPDSDSHSKWASRPEFTNHPDSNPAKAGQQKSQGISSGVGAMCRGSQVKGQITVKSTFKKPSSRSPERRTRHRLGKSKLELGMQSLGISKLRFQ